MTKYLPNSSLELVPAKESDIELLYKITQVSMSHLTSRKSNPQNKKSREHLEKYKQEFLPEIKNTFIITLKQFQDLKI